MTNYVILERIVPPRICFLWEAIRWRAFGTFPIAYLDMDGSDMREYPEGSKSFDAPIPDDGGEMPYLSQNQTDMVGLPPNPAYLYREKQEKYFDYFSVRNYFLRASEPEDSIPTKPFITKEQMDHIEAEYAKFSRIWRELHDAYVDQFQAELLLALRRGALSAHGRKLPYLDRAKSEEFFDEQGSWISDVAPSSIPADLWVSSYVNWQECSLQTPEHSYVWITITVEDMLRIFPPSQIIPHGDLKQLGNVYAFAENSVSAAKPETNRPRGRPPYNWLDFYIEVACHYRGGTMPEKKEAAIQMFVDWFKDTMGIKVSHSVVSDRLKPVFNVQSTNSNSTKN